MRPAIAGLLALLTVPASAAEVPLSGDYGTLMGCADLASGQGPPIPDDSMLAVTRDHVRGHEWECSYKTLTRSADLDWTVAANCGDEGEELDTSLRLQEQPGVGVILTADAFLDKPITLPSCDLPYVVQVRIEAERLR